MVDIAGIGAKSFSSATALFSHLSGTAAAAPATIDPDLAAPTPTYAVQQPGAAEGAVATGSSVPDPVSRAAAVTTVAGSPEAAAAGNPPTPSNLADPVQITITPDRSPPATLSANAARPSQLADYVTAMTKKMQNEFSSMQDVFKQPLIVPNIPGGQAFAETADRMMKLQITALNYQLEMSAAEQVRSTGKAVMDKFTEMKD